MDSFRRPDISSRYLFHLYSVIRVERIKKGLYYLPVESHLHDSILLKVTAVLRLALKYSESRRLISLIKKKKDYLVLVYNIMGLFCEQGTTIW